MVSPVHSSAADESSHGQVTGVIQPPPDTRVVVDKTAQFVARNGKSFEVRILASAEGQSAKFNFMRLGDPYNSYYEFKIREFEEGIGTNANSAAASPAAATATAVIGVAAAIPAQAISDSATSGVSTKKAVILAPIGRAQQAAPKEAPLSLQLLLNHPSGLSAMDLDIIKLTAQYTAASGRQFLAGLAQREQRNPQFDFLKPTHMLFSYFTALVDAYTRVISPPIDVRARLESDKDRRAVLQRVVHRWEWTRSEDEKRKQAQAEAEAERLAYQSVDWHDFVVVETIDFPTDELIDAQPSNAPSIDMEMDIDVEEAQPHAKLPFSPARPPPPPSIAEPPPPPQRPCDDNITIVTDYQPRVVTGAKGSDKLIDPITGKMIPADQMSEHMRIQLLDPKWQEEQRRNQENQKEHNFAEGAQIAESLAHFAKQRNDIFGSTEEEERALLEKTRSGIETHGVKANSTTAIGPAQGKAANEAAQLLPTTSFISTPYLAAANPSIQQPPALPLPVVHPPVLPPPTIPPPLIPLPVMPAAVMPAAVLPGPPLTRLPPSMPPPHMKAFVPLSPSPPAVLQPVTAGIPPLALAGLSSPPMAIDDGAPDAKRRRTDTGTGLVSETEFAASIQGAVSIGIKVPVDDSVPDWSLNGQMLSVSCDIMSPVKDVKALLSVQLGSMPPSKQQLKSSTLGFLKDNLTLAHYNIKPGSGLELLVRSRGGRK